MKPDTTTAEPLPALPVLLAEVLAVINAAVDTKCMAPFVRTELLTALDRFCTAAHDSLKRADVMVEDLRDANGRLRAMLDAARPEDN
jgi:hypothetical protein